MQNFRFTLYFGLICAIQFACNREPLSIPSQAPLNVLKPEINVSVEQIKVTKATVKATVTKPGNVNILGYGCVWDTLPNPTIALSPKIEISGKPPTGTFSFSIFGLKEKKLYYAQVYAITAKDTIYADIQTFTTKPHWTPLAVYPGGPVSGHAVFKIGDLMYAGTGYPNHTDFWAFDPALNRWTSKQSFPGAGLNAVASFEIDGTGFIGLGTDNNYQATNNFWAYNVQRDSFYRIADFPGMAREAPVEFALNDGIGYIGFGVNTGSVGVLDDFWSYNPGTNVWDSLGKFPIGKRENAISFTLDDKAYVGFGNKSQEIYNDLWEFNPAKPWSQCWRKLTSNEPRVIAFSFSLTNGFGYVGGGIGRKDFWKFDPNKGLGGGWERLPDLPDLLWAAAAVSMGDFAIVIGGAEGAAQNSTNKCWRYDPE